MNEVRMVIWDSAWNIFLSHWLTGVGLGNVRAFMMHFSGLDFESHHLILDMLAEQGITMLLVFLFAIAGPAIWIYRTRHHGTKNRDIAIALFIGICGFMLYGCITGERLISTTQYFSGHITYFLFISIALQYHLIVRPDSCSKRVHYVQRCEYDQT
jgi:O-antigen ligase